MSRVTHLIAKEKAYFCVPLQFYVAVPDGKLSIYTNNICSMLLSYNNRKCKIYETVRLGKNDKNYRNSIKIRVKFPKNLGR